MFKIGEFARMGQVSVRTLKHYEKLGLLKPFEIDRFTGYRYYSATQLPRLNRILALKDLGMSLEQIGRMLDADLTPDQLKRMLLLKQAEFRQQLEDTRQILMRLEAWLSCLGGNEMTMEGHYEVTLKKVEPILVASMRRTVPAYGNLGVPFRELRSYLSRNGTGHKYPSIVLWHFSTEELEDSFEVELAEQLDVPIPGNDQIKVNTLPPLEMAASVIHRGDLSMAFLAYQALGNWVEQHNYKVGGPTRQIHLAFNPAEDSSNYLTEFQLPVNL